MSNYGIHMTPGPQTPYRGGQFYSFLGGLNNCVADELIEQEELSAVENMVPDQVNAGVIAVREGISKISTIQTTAITSVFEGIHDIWATVSQDVINDAGTAQSLGLTAATAPDWASINNYDIMVNGAEAKKYNGAAWSALSNIPAGTKYVEVYNRFLFCGGHDKGKVRWSGIQAPETWDATNEWNLSPDSNDDVTGLIRFRDVLVAACERSWYLLRGYGEKQVQIVYRGEPGCTSHRSLVATPYGLYWWSDFGLQWSPEGYTSHCISELRIPRTIEGLNKSKYSLVHGLWNQTRQRLEYYVCNGSSTTVDLAIWYYPTIGVRNINGINVGSFWVQTGAGIQMGASGVVTVSGAKKVYLGSAATNGYLYEQTGSNDDGRTIPFYMESKRDSTEYGPASVKRLATVIPGFEYESNVTVTYGFYHDNQSSVSQSWNLSLVITGFVLDVDALGTGELAADIEGTEADIHWTENFRKLKHRMSADSTVKVKVRGIRTEGYLHTL